MNERSVIHGTFVIERTYDATPARVFAAWASAGAKSQWFRGPDEWQRSEHELDFRVGGRERIRGRQPDGVTHTFEGRYHDIVPERRIVSTYDMYQDDRRSSVSLATVELRPEGAGTRLIYSEHGAFLDGLDNAASREAGTRGLLDQLAEALRRGSAG